MRSSPLSRPETKPEPQVEPPRPEPKKRIRDPQRAERLLGAATQLFYERGFHAVGVDEIGEAAGVTGAAIYRYFGSKEELLYALFEEAIDRYLLALPDAREDQFEELEALIARHLELTLEHRELASIWAREDRALSGPYLQRLRRRERRYFDRWVACLSRCFPDREAADLVAAARAAIGTIVWLAARPGRISDREARVVSGVVAAGLRSLDGIASATEEETSDGQAS